MRFPELLCGNGTKKVGSQKRIVIMKDIYIYIYFFFNERYFCSTVTFEMS